MTTHEVSNASINPIINRRRFFRNTGAVALGTSVGLGMSGTFTPVEAAIPFSTAGVFYDKGGAVCNV